MSVPRPPLGNAADQTLTAAGFLVIYAVIIGFTDNFVRVIASETGLWQFHMTRSAMAMVLLALAVPILGLRPRPKRLGAVAARSAVHGFAMLIYFGALAFLPVALVAAGLFTAPIFVLLIMRFAYGAPIRPLQALAVALGFSGVLLVLGPEALGGASLAALLPVAAGAMYGLGNIATRAWCAEETAATLLAGFFLVLGLFGAIGIILLWLFPLTTPAGPAGFVLRGPVWPPVTFYFWTFVQAAGSLIAVGLMIRGYQLTDAARASVIEYAILPAAAIWGWVIWGDALGPFAILGMALIAGAGALIAFGGRKASGG